MKPTRRELATGALGTAALATALASGIEAQPPDLTKQVRDAVDRNSATLSKYEIPIATEPAFRFEP